MGIRAFQRAGLPVSDDPDRLHVHQEAPLTKSEPVAVIVSTGQRVDMADMDGLAPEEAAQAAEMVLEIAMRARGRQA